MSQRTSIKPSPFIADWLARLGAAPGPPRRRALDVACGRGRHAAPLVQSGFVPFGVDNRFDVLAHYRAAAVAAGGAVRVWCADLTAARLPHAHFDLIVVSRYLQRDLFPSLRAALTPCGVVLYETFTTEQLAHGTGPRSAEHLLRAGELRDAFAGFDLLFYEEASGPEALARLAARRPR